MSDRIEIHIAQFFHRFWSVFLCSPEPTGSNTCICLRNCPLISIFKTNCRISLLITVDCVFLLIYSGLWPCIFSGDSQLISDPTNRCICFCSKQHTIGISSCCLSFIFLNCIKPLFKLVFLCICTASFGTIHPHFYEFPIISILIITQNFC